MYDWHIGGQIVKLGKKKKKGNQGVGGPPQGAGEPWPNGGGLRQASEQGEEREALILRQMCDTFR